jgi:hypothetical protein
MKSSVDTSKAVQPNRLESCGLASTKSKHHVLDLIETSRNRYYRRDERNSRSSSLVDDGCLSDILKFKLLRIISLLHKMETENRI